MSVMGSHSELCTISREGPMEMENGWKYGGEWLGWLRSFRRDRQATWDLCHHRGSCRRVSLLRGS